MTVWRLKPPLWVTWRHTGTFGRLGPLSFNGHKIITTGGGGMIITDDADLAARAQHLKSLPQTVQTASKEGRARRRIAPCPA
jgi:dTDP-4-amino-4,6-dideoxygalactose transaminase